MQGCRNAVMWDAGMQDARIWNAGMRGCRRCGGEPGDAPGRLSLPGSPGAGAALAVSGAGRSESLTEAQGL